MSGRYNYHTIFRDWVELMALSIQNSCCLIHNKIWEDREQQYKNIMQKYTLEERMEFPEMLAMLVDEFTDGNISDILGEIYMSQGSGNGRLGQFFTPFHSSLLNAALVIPENVNPENPLVINEPSAGGGGMIIAVVKILLDSGINPQQCMDVVAQDLDWQGVYMTYVQLSLLGIKATVVQGDTLREPFVDARLYPQERVLYSPARKGIIL